MQQPVRLMLSTKLKCITPILLTLLSGLASPLALAENPSTYTDSVNISAPENFGESYLLKITDKSSKEPVANTPVRIYSHHEKLCVLAPCQTNGMDWEGITNAQGALLFPSKLIQNSIQIFVTGYRAANFTREAKIDASGVWAIALDARVLAIGSVSSEPIPAEARIAKIRCYEQKEIRAANSVKPLKKLSDDWCGRSFCGCSTKVKLKCVTKVVSATPATPDLQPIYPTNLFPEPNVKISCGEHALAVSDSEGNVAFTLLTSTSPACGTQCGTLLFTKERPTSYETWEVDIDYGAWTALGQDYHQKGERANGKNNGSWREWCSRRQWGNIDQQLSVSGQFKDGQKDGEWTEWHCTGGMKSQGLYKDGKKEGVWKEWYENGQIHYQAEWHVDKLHGKQFFWYSEGRLESESEFRDGEYFGVRKYFPKEGEAYYLDHRGFVIKAE